MTFLIRLMTLLMIPGLGFAAEPPAPVLYSCRVSKNDHSNGSVHLCGKVALRIGRDFDFEETGLYDPPSDRTFSRLTSGSTFQGCPQLRLTATDRISEGLQAVKIALSYSTKTGLHQWRPGPHLTEASFTLSIPAQTPPSFDLVLSTTESKILRPVDHSVSYGALCYREGLQPADF